MSASNVLFLTTSASAVQQIAVKSPAFQHLGLIPKKYTADGANINPPLTFSKIPSQAQSLVLLVEDPNAPIDTWVHWLVWDIAPTEQIHEGTIPGTQGLNAFQKHHYHGPCPPANTRYYTFKVYALNTVLRKHNNSTKYEIMKAMQDHVIAYGELTGTYNRNVAVNTWPHVAPDMYA